MANQRVSKGVILAAGEGSRLGHLTATCPKVLLSVRGKPLIWHSIEALIAAGIEEIALVVGYSATQVETTLGDGSRFGATLEYITNADYLGGNGISVGKAKAWIGGGTFRPLHGRPPYGSGSCFSPLRQIPCCRNAMR